MVTTESSFAVFTGGTSLSLPFQFHEASDLRVALVAPDSSKSYLTEGIDYSVSGGDGETGAVTLTAEIPAGYSVLVRRVLPLTQELDLTSQGTFQPDEIERQLDRHMMILQQISDGEA